MVYNVVEELKSTDVLSISQADTIKNYIDEKYKNYSKKEAAIVFADAIHKVLDKELEFFSDNNRIHVKEKILKEAVQKKEFCLNGLDIIVGIAETEDDSKKCFEFFNKWLDTHFDKKKAESILGSLNEFLKLDANKDNNSIELGFEIEEISSIDNATINTITLDNLALDSDIIIDQNNSLDDMHLDITKQEPIDLSISTLESINQETENYIDLGKSQLTFDDKNYDFIVTLDIDFDRMKSHLKKSFSKVLVYQNLLYKTLISILKKSSKFTNNLSHVALEHLNLVYRKSKHINLRKYFSNKLLRDLKVPIISLSLLFIIYYGLSMTSGLTDNYHPADEINNVLIESRNSKLEVIEISDDMTLNTSNYSSTDFKLGNEFLVKRSYITSSVDEFESPENIGPEIVVFTRSFENIEGSQNPIISTIPGDVLARNDTRLSYRNIKKDSLREYLVQRDSLLGQEPYLSAIMDTAKAYNLNPLFLFAITGQEQGFVPTTNTKADIIANNPFNVYGSWQKYNTDIYDSSAIAARTVIILADGCPEGTNPITWINRKYAEDQNWWVGVDSIYEHMKKNIK